MLRSPLTILASLALANAAFAAPAQCPTDDRPRLLREAPEKLEPCGQSNSPAARVWGAHAARAMGHSQTARTLYTAAAADPTLAEARPSLLLAAARAAGEAGDPAAGLTLLEGLEASRRWVRSDLAAAQADLALAAGQPSAARNFALQALKLGHPAADALRGVVARAALKEGDRAAFGAALRELQTENPDSGVTAAVEQLAIDGARDALAPADWARRWARWNARGGASGVAQECIPRLESLRAGKAATDLARARLECGRALSTLRRPEAVRLLQLASEERSLRAQALLAVARIQARDENPVPVQATCRAIADTKARDELAECSFLAGFMQLNRGQRAAAQSALEQVIQRFPKHSRASDAAWFLAFDAFRQSPESAFPRFDALVQRARDATERAQALYWRARARPASGLETSRAEWAEVVQLDPLGYYGWLAATRLGTSSAAARTSEACARPAARRGEPPEAARRVHLLLELGLRRAAALEMAESLSPRQRTALEWSAFLVEAEQFERLLDVGVAQGGQGGPWPATGDRQLAVEAAFPRAFPDALAAAPASVDRCFLLSLMRRESRFNPDAASAAQARGLLQLLPKTVEQLARDLGESTPPPEHLHDPQVNLHFAGTYVQRLGERFGHPLLVAAAYNAGPNAVVRWTSDMAGIDLDEWVERIPYRETRAYVKAVGGAYAAYGLVYTGARPSLSLAPVKKSGPGIEF